MHIESGNCPLANEDGHRRDQVKPKAFGGKNILDMRHSNSSSDTETAEDGLSSEDNEQVGGVRLDLASSPAYQTPSAAFAQLSEQSFSADSSTDSSYDSLSENILAAPRSPDLECGGVPLYQQIPVFAPDSAGDGRYPSADPNELRYASILGAFEPPVVSLSTEGVVSAYQQSPVYAPGSSHDGRFPLTELKEQSGSSSLRKPLEQPTLTNTCLGTAAQGNPFLSGSIPKVADMSQRVMNAPLPSTTSHRKLSNVDPQQFWNAERSRFVCNCGTSYATAREFRTHITLDDDSTIKESVAVPT
jgi:hypothetical protein